MRQAVLLVDHGTVDDLDEMPAFLRNVRRGHEAPEELVVELRRRYAAIGGRSPLRAINARIAAKLEAVLAVPVRAASRLWKPYAADVIAELGELDRIAVVPLAQHSAHVYAESVRAAAKVQIVSAGNWGQTPALLDAFAKRIREIMKEDDAIVLTAHSLPKSVIAAGDAYEREVRASAEGVAMRLGREVIVAFQSQGAGATAATWLGPTLVDALDEVAGRKKKRVVIAPIGFLADHVEILYDVDIEAKALARERGIELVRSESLNDADDFIAVLATIARELLSAAA